MEQQYRTRLPGWEILEPPIGTGGFSTVYEIVRVDKFGMEEHAALKVISVPENNRISKPSAMTDWTTRALPHISKRRWTIFRENSFCFPT